MLEVVCAPAVEVQNLNHWTAKEVLVWLIFKVSTDLKKNFRTNFKHSHPMPEQRSKIMVPTVKPT